jgi:hypothetical protein
MKSQIKFLRLTFYEPWATPCQESTHTPSILLVFSITEVIKVQPLNSATQKAMHGIEKGGKEAWIGKSKEDYVLLSLCSNIGKAFFFNTKTE